MRCKGEQRVRESRVRSLLRGCSACESRVCVAWQRVCHEGSVVPGGRRGAGRCRLSREGDVQGWDV